MKTLKVLLSSLAVVALVSTAACKKDEKKDGDKPADDTAAKKPADTNTAAKPGDKPATPDTKPADPAAGAPADAATEAKAQKAIAFMKGMVTAVAAKKGDCDAMADAMTGYMKENKEFWDKAKSWDKDPAFKKLMDEKYSKQMMADMKPLIEAGEACKDSEKFKAAMSAM